VTGPRPVWCTPLCLRRMTMELRHLRCFLAIAEEGTLTRAATRLHLTQPVVSRTLRQLEDHLGVRLIDRSTHHLGLTAAGHSFRIRAASAVAAADAAFDPAQLGVWPLRLGHAWSTFGEFTVSLLRSWLQEYPDVPLELRRIEDRTAGLARGEVDAALLRGPVTTPGIRTEPLMMEPRLVAVPAGTPLAARSRLTLGDLAGYPVVLNAVPGTTTTDLWPASIRPEATIEVASTDDWLAAIAAGKAVGVTTTATASVHPNPGIAYRPLAGAADLTVSLAWTHPPTHPAIGKLVTLARELVGYRPPGAT
jgi:DNA-binding transcriptional LysR family regulator